MTKPNTHTSPAKSTAGSTSSKAKGQRGTEKLMTAYLCGSRTLEQLAEGLTPAELQEAETVAAYMAVGAAKASAYLLMRGAAGCGDHGHDDANKKAKKAEKKARQLIGFSYP